MSERVEMNPRAVLQLRALGFRAELLVMAGRWPGWRARGLPVAFRGPAVPLRELVLRAR